MNPDQSKYLAERLNEFGVLVYSEVNGIQHQFKLSLKELSPTSVVYQRNAANIADTEYTLIPIEKGRAIYNIGKKIFESGLRNITNEFKDKMSAFDYTGTKYGRYVALKSLPKMRKIANELKTIMWNKADETIKTEYTKYYKETFVFAYRFYSFEMKEFRDQLKILEGQDDLFWEEVKNIYEDLQKIEEDIKKYFPKRKLSMADLERPDVKTAHKLRDVPQTYEQYRGSIGVNFIYTGLHPLSFINHDWKEQYWTIQDFEGARDLLFPVIYR